MGRAWAVLQHQEPRGGTAAALALHPQPTGLAARPPWAPGTPGPTALFFRGGFCLPHQLTVGLPITHLGERQAQGLCTGCAALPATSPSPPSPAANQCRRHWGMSILGRGILSCWGFLGLADLLGSKRENQLAGSCSHLLASASCRPGRSVHTAAQLILALGTVGDPIAVLLRVQAQPGSQTTGQEATAQGRLAGTCGHSKKGPAVLLSPPTPSPQKGWQGGPQGTGGGRQVGGGARPAQKPLGGA